MSTEPKVTGVPPDEKADMQAVVDAVVAGKPVDPDVARRVEERADKARAEILATQGVQDIAVQLIRELRGPLDEEQERELTLAQREILHRGDARLVDPDTGEFYVLVREDEYQRLRNR